MSLTDKAKDRAKKNPRLLFVILVILHLIVISLNRVPGQPDIRYVQKMMLTGATPLQWLTSHGVSSIKSVWTGYFDLRGAKSENERLKTRIAELEAQNIELREKDRLLDQLNALILSPTLSSYQRVSAMVIGRDPDQWFNTVVIDRGSLVGVLKDQPVVTSDGVVGRVISVSPISSRVLLITDERHGVGAVIAQTADSRLVGILRGKDQSLCELRLVAAAGKLENGEQVITSGQDRLYPKGLLIGPVKNLSDTGAIPPKVDVEPAAQLQKLETVAVLLIPPEEIRRQFDELIKAEEKERQERTPDRRRR
jgi:rod shape-determining protein MreC